MPICPICKRTVEARGKNGAFPFCSSRCKQVDLGNWLDEAYRVRASAAETDDPSDDLREPPQLEDA